MYLEMLLHTTNTVTRTKDHTSFLSPVICLLDVVLCKPDENSHELV